MSINRLGKLRALIDSVLWGFDGSADRQVKTDSDGHLQIDVLSDEEYTSRIYSAGGYTYIGEAAIGSATSSAVWKVSRVDSSGAELFADSNSNFDNIVDNYATLTYG